MSTKRYLVLHTNANNKNNQKKQKIDCFYQHVRDACLALMEWADSQHYYSAIAVTKNFVGLPHIDNRDQTYQYIYALSLGNFAGDFSSLSSSSDLEDEDPNRIAVVVVVVRRKNCARIGGIGAWPLKCMPSIVPLCWTTKQVEALLLRMRDGLTVSFENDGEDKGFRYRIQMLEQKIKAILYSIICPYN
jgi:hypothetical protein